MCVLFYTALSRYDMKLFTNSFTWSIKMRPRGTKANIFFFLLMYSLSCPVCCYHCNSLICYIIHTRIYDTPNWPSYKQTLFNLTDDYIIFTILFFYDKRVILVEKRLEWWKCTHLMRYLWKISVLKKTFEDYYG